MANSKIFRLFQGSAGLWPASRTPGPLGTNDHGDPRSCTRLGDTPGALGLGDWGDPGLPILKPGQFSLRPVVRLPGGQPLALGAELAITTASPTEAVADGSITLEQLKKVFPRAADSYLTQVATELNTDLAKYGLNTQLRKAHFFAQVRQESGAGLDAKVENMNYSPEGLKSTFGYYRAHPDEAVTDGYERDQKTQRITRAAGKETIANKVYANRIGNGDSRSGDGWRFRGRGLIQVTGRANYADATRQYRKLYAGGLDVDFEQNPELVQEFPYTIRSAVCFWIQHALHQKADAGSTMKDVDRITNVINPGTKSVEERRQNFTLAFDAFR